MRNSASTAISRLISPIDRAKAARKAVRKGRRWAGIVPETVGARRSLPRKGTAPRLTYRMPLQRGRGRMIRVVTRMIEGLRRRPYSLMLALVLIGLSVAFCRAPTRTGTPSTSSRPNTCVTAKRSSRTVTCIRPPAPGSPCPSRTLSGVPGRLAWYGVNALAVVVMLTSAWRLAGGGRLQGEPSVPRREHAILALGLLASVYYALDALSNQQTDLVVGGLVLGGCLLLANKRELWAAVPIGVAAGIKCTPLLWAPYLMWCGRWCAAGVVVAVALAVNLVPDLTHPPPGGGPVEAVRRHLPLADGPHRTRGRDVGVRPQLQSLRRRRLQPLEHRVRRLERQGVCADRCGRPRSWAPSGPRGSSSPPTCPPSPRPSWSCAGRRADPPGANSPSS